MQAKESRDIFSFGEEKVSTTNDSRDSTEASNNFFHKKLSMRTCWSSISVQHPEENEKNKKQRALFVKYLHKKSSGEKTERIIAKMKTYCSLLSPEAFKNHINGQGSIFKPWKGENVSEQEIIRYFSISWLLSMGYGKIHNKNLIMKKIKIQTPVEQLYDAVEFYQTFGANILSPHEQFRLIEETCRNGWEYFSSFFIEKMNEKRKIQQ